MNTGTSSFNSSSPEATIKKLVDRGLVPMRQVVPFAPWEIQRTDLDSDRVRTVITRLKQTRRLVVGDTSDTQPELFQ